MNAIPLTKIEGDTTVSRNAAMGGNVRVGGSALIKHGLRVEGWADLPNIKGCDKGLFESFEALNAAYPQPRPGWWAMTYTTTGSGETLEATYTMYMVEEGVWVSKGTTTTPQEFDTQLFQYLEDFDNLEKRDDELAAAIDAEEAAREATDRNLAESIAQEVADREDADAALEERLDAEVTARADADTALGGRIDTESTERVTADKALANDISKVAGDLAEEAATRLDQITALRDDLEGEMQNCRDADEALANTIADETHSRQSEDEELDGKIAEEVRRAQAVETLLRDDLTALSTDAQETESSLKGLQRSIGMPGGIAPLDSDGTIASRFIPGAMDDVKVFSGCVNSSIFEENGVRFYESTEDTSAAPNSYVVYDTHLQRFLLKQYAGGGAYDFYRTWGDAELWNDLDAGSPHDDKVYVDRTTNKTYRWAEDYGLVVIGTDLALGETAYTAYPGNLGAQLARGLSDEVASRTDADELLQEQIFEHRRELHYLPDNFATEKALFTAAGTYAISTKPIKPGALLLGCVDECWGVYQYVYFNDEVEISAQSEEAVRAVPASAPTIAPPAVKHDANVSNPENWVRLATIEDVAALKKLVPVVELTADEIAALLPADESQIATLELDAEDEAGADQPATSEALERFRTRLRQMRGRSIFKPKEVYNPNDYINYEHE